MKRLILLLCVFSYGVLGAQEFETIEAQFTPSGYTLYTYGSKVTSSKCNLQNLFSNFPRFFKKTGTIDLQSFYWVGNINSKKDAKRYIRANIYDNPKWIYPTKGKGYIKSRQYTGPFGTVEMCIEDYDQYPVKEKKKEEKAAGKSVRIGDEVWAVEYTYCQRRYVSYVFIDSKTNEVRKDGDIWCFSIPQCLMSEVQNKK